MASIVFQFFLSSLVTVFCLVPFCSAHAELPRLLLISFDGFRWDYLAKAKSAGRHTPNFDELISSGIQIDGSGIKNVFITKTFPNHYSLVTGLYEETHGIVANNFYDPVYNDTFSLSSMDLKWWNGTGSVPVEPIWMTNEKASEGHVERVSGVFFWPGSDVKGQQPKYHEHYDPTVNFTYRVDTVVNWFIKEDDPINLGLLYFEEPDGTGHKYGPDSTEMLNMIEALDKVVGHLIDKLKEHRMFDGLNLIITSDHGMTSMSGTVYLDDYVDSSLYTHYGTSPIFSILPKSGQEDVVYKSLKKAANLLVFKKEDIPPEWHYVNNRRIQPILISAIEGFRICQNRAVGWCNESGNHGYNNSLSSMHPIFIAHGPAFKKQYKAPQFHSVDVYPLICHIINLTPRPNNGSLGAVKNLLQEDDVTDLGFITYVFVIAFVCVMSCICCVGAIRSYSITTRRLSMTWRKNVPSTLSRKDGKEPLLVSDEEEDIA